MINALIRKDYGIPSLQELKAKARPAAKLEIAKCLALLLKAFPNAGNADVEIFGGLLIQDVVDANPTIGDIEDACRQIRRTSKFLPTIAEVLEALSEAQEERLCLTRSMVDPEKHPRLEPPRPQVEQRQALYSPVTSDLTSEADLLPL